MKKPITAITTRTDAEWPADHPIRKVASVIPNEIVKSLKPGEGLLVCTIEGEYRKPAPEGDSDVSTKCSRCPSIVVHRASAPKNLSPVCHVCYAKLMMDFR